MLPKGFQEGQINNQLDRFLFRSINTFISRNLFKIRTNGYDVFHRIKSVNSDFATYHTYSSFDLISSPTIPIIHVSKQIMKSITTQIFIQKNNMN